MTHLVLRCTSQALQSVLQTAQEAVSSGPINGPCLSIERRPPWCRLHRIWSSGHASGPQLVIELKPLRISDDGELLKPDGMLTEDEDAALRRTIAALVLNLRGIDPDLREQGLDVLCGLAARKCVSLRSLTICRLVRGM